MPEAGLVEDSRSMEISWNSAGDKAIDGKSSDKVFHRPVRSQAQKALTGKNLGGYDAVTDTKLVNNGVWDGHGCFPQVGELRATAGFPWFADCRRFGCGYALHGWRLAKRQPCPAVLCNFFR